MTTTYTLARFFGICLLVMGVAVIVRGGELWGVLHGMIADPAMVLLVGMLSLAAGLSTGSRINGPRHGPAIH